jgi:hypothetical protein
LVAIGILFLVLSPQKIQREIEFLVRFKLAVKIVKISAEPVGSSNYCRNGL